MKRENKFNKLNLISFVMTSITPTENTLNTQRINKTILSISTNNQFFVYFKHYTFIFGSKNHNNNTSFRLITDKIVKFHRWYYSVMIFSSWFTSVNRVFVYNCNNKSFRHIIFLYIGIHPKKVLPVRNLSIAVLVGVIDWSFYHKQANKSVTSRIRAIIVTTDGNDRSTNTINKYFHRELGPKRCIIYNLILWYLIMMLCKFT